MLRRAAWAALISIGLPVAGLGDTPTGVKLFQLDYFSSDLNAVAPLTLEVSGCSDFVDATDLGNSLRTDPIHGVEREPQIVLTPPNHRKLVIERVRLESYWLRFARQQRESWNGQGSQVLVKVCPADIDWRVFAGGVELSEVLDADGRGFPDILNLSGNVNEELIALPFEQAEFVYFPLKPRPLFGNKMPSSDEVGSMGRDGRRTGYPYGILHVAGLLQSEVAQYSRSQDQAHGGREQRKRPPYKGSIGFLFLLSVFCLLGTFFCGFKGGQGLYEERRAYAAIWLCIGCLSGLLAMAFVLLV